MQRGAAVCLDQPTLPEACTSACIACIQQLSRHLAAEQGKRHQHRLQDRHEENMTLDEMLASAMLDEMLDEEGTPAMEVEDIAFVGECSWAERDAESRARAVDLGD